MNFLNFKLQMRNQNPRADAVKQAEAKKAKDKDELLDLNKLLKPVEQKVAKGAFLYIGISHPHSRQKCYLNKSIRLVQISTNCCRC